MREKLTDRLAKTLGPGLYWDTHDDAPKGFLLQVTPAGARAYRLNYRRQSDGVERRLTIGDAASWPVAEARKRAAELRRIVDAGGDPLGQAQELRAAPTVAELVARFIEEALPSRAPGTQEEYRAMLRDYILPAIGHLKVASVDREHIERLHRKITEAGKTRRANAVKSLCSTIFRQAVIWKMRADNPARDIKRNPEPGRERYLTDPETGRLVDVLAGWAHADVVDVINMAMHSGARRGEILKMTWDQVDLDAGVWTKPGTGPQATKQRRVHRVPLSAEAVELLHRRRGERDMPQQVVPLRRDGRVFLGLSDSALQYQWVQIRAAAGIPDVRFHDLRHSFASWLASQGMSLPIIGQLLGHSAPATTARYAHLSLEAQRQALDLVGKSIAGRNGSSK